MNGAKSIANNIAHEIIIVAVSFSIKRTRNRVAKNPILILIPLLPVRLRRMYNTNCPHVVGSSRYKAPPLVYLFFLIPLAKLGYFFRTAALIPDGLGALCASLRADLARLRVLIG